MVHQVRLGKVIPRLFDIKLLSDFKGNFYWDPKQHAEKGLSTFYKAAKGKKGRDKSFKLLALWKVGLQT